jgi:hypothetical protein
MKAETWLPILTLVLGWGLAQVTEVLRDRRATNRDRLARRAELQRMTLLELQEALADQGGLRVQQGDGACVQRWPPTALQGRVPGHLGHVPGPSGDRGGRVRQPL